MGFVRVEELAAVRRHIARLENQIADMRTSAPVPAAAPVEAAEPVAAVEEVTEVVTESVEVAESKVEDMVNFGTVDDSKVEDVVEATSELADTVAAQGTPAKRKIPYVKPGTEIGEDA